MQSVLQRTEKREEQVSDTFDCPICNIQNIPSRYQLVYTHDKNENDTTTTSCCHCNFCEVCFWTDILQHVDERQGNVVICPCCGADDHDTDQATDMDAQSTALLSPKQRGQRSKERFLDLPIDSIALKKSGRKKKKTTELESLSSSWAKAVIPSLGLCQSVRTDKFFTYTDKNAIHFVRGLLEAGVNVDATNEYGQPPLYMAAWCGFADMVELLLQYGADPWIQANGMMTLEGVCRAHGQDNCLDIIKKYRRDYWESTPADLEKYANGSVEHNNAHTQMSMTKIKTCAVEPMLRVLIDETVNHPGAGSYLISDWIEDVEPILELWRTIPVDTSSKKKNEKKLETCSERSYFCDSEGWLRSTLQRCIKQAFQKHSNRALQEDAVVLSHMRFLHYKHRGSSLAPHVDLCRVEPRSGQRSTHSFLFYLTTCETGGETVLLGDVRGEGRDVVMASVKPTLGHLLLFPHACPHEGNVVDCVPKLLIRGEVILTVANGQSLDQ
eukprot:Sro1081_g239090.1 SAM and basic leucine zipper domain-containing protein 1 (497) ;mRNA; r:20734-22224